MPYAFNLPTTSAVSLTEYFASQSHPTFIQTCSTQRHGVRSALKKFKRLSPLTQAAYLPVVRDTLETYLSSIVLLKNSTSRDANRSALIVDKIKDLNVEWRSTLSATIAGRDLPRKHVQGLSNEIAFALTVLAEIHSLLARSKIVELYASATPTSEQRVQLLQASTKDLLTASSIHKYVATTVINETDTSSAVLETLCQTQSALAELALAEATLLAVLKDDPYPFLLIQSRNTNDREWMVQPPEIPKVRAHLFARLCLAAAEHLAKADAGLSASGRVDGSLASYVGDLTKVAKARACRFLGIDAELDGKTGIAIAWLDAALQTLNSGARAQSGTEPAISSLRKLKKTWNEQREDRKIEQGTDWGSDAGKLEEGRVIGYLHAKWTKMNDTINTQIIPASLPLLSTLPSGRDVHSTPPYQPPSPSALFLSQMRAPVDSLGEGQTFSEGDSSEVDEASTHTQTNVPGAFPKPSLGDSRAVY